MQGILVFSMLPAIVFIISIVGYILLKKWYVTPIIFFIIFSVLATTIFKGTLFLYVIFLTALSIVVSLIMGIKGNNKQ
ncbi:YbeF family protein [Bacillus sp. IITD106]|nr:YbeF family protein [Bacillus sp. IITD106]